MLKIKKEQDLTLPRRVLLNRKEKITTAQAEQMLHAIGADNKKARRYAGRKIYHAYRNYYDAGGTDIALWDDLAVKGYAQKGRCFYSVTTDGLRLLQMLTESVIYDEYDCVADFRGPMLREFIKADVYCGHGCWFPTSAAQIAHNLMVPEKLARDTAKALAAEELIVRGYFGGLDDEGFPYCAHGYYLTQKARQSEEWEALYKEEMEYLNNQLGRPYEKE